MAPPGISTLQGFCWLPLVALCVAGLASSDGRLQNWSAINMSELENWFSLNDGSLENWFASAGGLEDWLMSLEITIPDGTIPPIEANVHILLVDVHISAQIHKIVCSGLQIGALNSRPKELDGESNAVAANAQQVALSCTASVDYQTSMLGTSGTATGQLHTEGASLSLSLQMPRWNSPGDRGNTSYVVLESCQCNPALKLEITGGTFWTKFAEYLPGVISKLQDVVNNQLSTYVCDSAGSDAILRLNNLINKTIEESSSSQNASHPHEIWNETWVALDQQSLATAVNRFQDNFMYPYNVCDRFLGDRCLIGAEITCMHEPMCLVDNVTGCMAPGIIPTEPAAALGLRIQAANWHFHGLNISPVVFTNATVSLSASAGVFGLQSVLRVNFSSKQQGTSRVENGLDEDDNVDSLDMLLNITLESVEIGANMTIGLDNNAFEQLPSYKYFVPECVVPTIRELDINNISAGFVLRNLSLQPLEPSSGHSKSLFRDVLKLATDMVSGLLGARDLATTLLSGFVQHRLADSLSQSVRDWAKDHRNDICPPPRGEENYQFTGKPLIRPVVGENCCWLALGIVTLAFVSALSCHCRPILGRRVRGFHDALCMSAAVPRTVAILIPLSIVAGSFFFLASNYLLMAETFVNVETGTRRHPDIVLNVYQVMVYSVFYSIDALYYESHMETLSWVLLGFSLVLPYVKLFFMMLGWIAPERLLPRKARGFIFVVMDEIGKYSLVDIFVVQYISGIFYLEFTGKSASEDEGMRILLRTREDVGFAAFVSATIASLFIGHACRHYHERCHKHQLQSEAGIREIELGSEGGTLPATDQLDVSLMPQSHNTQEAASQPVDWRQYLVGVFLLIGLALCVVGCVLPAFTVSLDSPPLTYLGSSTYSFFGFANNLRSFSSYPMAFASIFNQITFVVFAIGTICLHFLILILLCFRIAPQLQSASTLAHCLGAWSSLDVALLALVITLEEMQQSDFAHLDGGTKDTLSRVLGKEVTSDHGLLVHISLEIGTYVLIAAALIHLVFSRVALLFLKV